MCKECLDMDARGEKRLGKDVRCKLCVEEGIWDKRDVKRKDERELRDYEEKLLKAKGGGGGGGEEELEEEMEMAYDHEPAPNPTNETRLWIGNLNNRVMTIDLLFSVIPNIKFAQWLTNPEGGCRGFCFVEMKSAEDAAYVMGMAGTKVKGRPLKVNYQKADNKSAWPPPNAVYA